MKCFNLFLLLAVLFLSNYAFAQIPPCPCDTETLSNGLTGNDIVELVCPGGVLGDDSDSEVEKDSVGVSIVPAPHGSYFAQETSDGDKFCFLNMDGALFFMLQITDEEYELCRQRLIEGCGLAPLNVNVPTLSEWGLLALAGILGIVGFMVIRRRKVSA